MEKTGFIHLAKSDKSADLCHFALVAMFKYVGRLWNSIYTCSFSWDHSLLLEIERNVWIFTSITADMGGVFGKTAGRSPMAAEA